MTNWEQEFRQLHEHFVSTLPSRLNTLNECWNLWCFNWGEAAKYQFRFEVHKLAGATSSYGLTDLSERAQAVELYLQSLTPNQKPSNEEIEHLTEAVEFLTKTGGEIVRDSARIASKKDIPANGHDAQHNQS